MPNTITINLAATATALAANPTDCSANEFADAIAASGNLTCNAIVDADVPDTITIDLAATATALAANGGNCSAGEAPLGVDASGAVESCTDYEEDLSNSAGLLAALSDETGTGVAVFGTAPTFGGTTVVTGSGSSLTLALDCTLSANGGALTTTSLGVVQCSDDDSGAGATGTVNTIKEADSQVGGADIVTLDFGAGFDLVESPDTEIQISWDVTEVTINFSDLTGAAVDAQVPDDITIDLATTATALAANPTDCAANQFADAIVASGNLTCNAIVDADVPDSITITLAATATALAADGGDCSAGSAPIGVDANGVAESCTDYEEDLSDSAGLLAALSDETGTGLSVFNTAPTFAGTTVITGSGSSLTLSLDCTLNSNGGALTTTALGVVQCSDDDSGAGATGTVNTIKEADSQVGGADIVTLDFGAGFDLVESPDTEIQISWDVSEVTINFTNLTGSATDAQVPDTITIDLAATATALAANPTDCAANEFADAIAASGNLTCNAIVDADVPDSITIDLAATATALAANGGNCSAGEAPLGVDASGAVESCTDYEEDLSNSAGLLAALSDETGTGVAVFNTAPTFAGTTTITGAGSSLTLALDCTLNSNGGALTTTALGVVQCSDDDSGAGATGTVNKIEEDNSQVGGSDIVTIDFGTGFDVAESPDTEVNITIDVSELTINFTDLTGAATDAQVPDNITIDLAATATALAADPTDCAANNFAISIIASGNLTCAQVAFSDLTGSATDAQVPDTITIDLAATATALAANPTDCGANSYATAIDAVADLTCTTLDGVEDIETATDDAVLVGTGAVFDSKVLTDCDAAQDGVTYDTTTNAFGCNTLYSENAYGVAITGDLTTSLDFESVNIPARATQTIQTAECRVGTAPVGADILVDIHYMGVTIFSTQSNRVTIAAGTLFDVSGAPSTTAITGSGAFFNWDIDQIGSSTAGADLSCILSVTTALVNSP